MSLGRDGTDQLLPREQELKFKTFFCYLAVGRVFLVSGGEARTISPFSRSSTHCDYRPTVKPVGIKTAL